MLEHIVKANPQHCRLATGQPLIGEMPTVDLKLDLHFGLEIPHFLKVNSNSATLIFPSDRSLERGDLLINEWNKSRMVTEIVERRKARGDWGRNPFDEHPDFIHVNIL